MLLAILQLKLQLETLMGNCFKLFILKNLLFVMIIILYGGESKYFEITINFFNKKLKLK